MNPEFPLLGNHAYVSFIQKLDSMGANRSTHIAEVRYPVQAAPVLSVVKFLDPNFLAASNEAIAWLFLRAAGFAAPRHAAILALTEKKARDVVGKRAFDESLVSQGHVIAWASQKLDFKSIRAYFVGTRADAQWIGLLRTLHGAQIAAFDEVFLNADRNTGNVLYSSRESCIPIDHEQIFDHQDWIGGNILAATRDSDSLRVIKRAYCGGALSLSAFNDIMNKMVHHAQQHESALAVCKDQISKLISNVFKEESATLEERVLSFAAERTAAHWMETRLGVV
jgi:hypothetical protein